MTDIIILVLWAAVISMVLFAVYERGRRKGVEDVIEATKPLLDAIERASKKAQG